MIKIEIVAQDITEFFAKLRGILSGSVGMQDQPPAPMPLAEVAKIIKEGRPAKGAGSEPEVVEAKTVLADPPNEREKAEALVEPRHTIEVARVVDGSRPLDAGVTVSMVRESLLALLPIGDDEPEAILAAFQVKKISLLKPEEFAAVKAAADKRLKEWQDVK